MKFGATEALWFLAALPVIVLLHMLRARRSDVRVSSVLLWQRAREDLQAHAPIRRLQRSLLLLLQLLAAASLALALARPSAVVPFVGGQATVVVIDVSMRMQATDVAPSRFEASRAAAMAEISSTAGPVMVVRAGPLPRAVTGFVSSSGARAAVASLSVTGAPSPLDQAVALALGQRVDGRRPRVVVFSDHIAGESPGVEFRIVGQSRRNLAITGVRAEQTVGGREAIVHVRNASPTRERVPLTVTLNDREILVRTVEVPPTATVAIPIPLRGEGTLIARIDARDAIPADDVGYAVIGEAPRRVVVAGESDRALDAALAAAGADVTTTATLDSAAIDSADVVVLNRIVPGALSPGNYLLFGVSAPNLPLDVDGVIASPRIIRQSSRHPVMRYADLRGVAIARALALHPGGGEVLAEGDGPLIWAYDSGGLRAIVCGFALSESDLPVQGAFPIFVRNALSWLAGAGVAYEAGQPWIVPARGETQAALGSPDGSRARLTAQRGQFVVPALEQVGVYTLQVGSRLHRIAVNPAASSADISPIRPPVSEAATILVPFSRRAIDLAPPLLAAALLIVLAEWVVWLRRLPPVRSAVSRPVIRR